MTRTRRRLAPGISLGLALASAVAAQGGWEPIAADYSNLRGTNYIASYESLTHSSRSPAGYNGVASSTAMWRFASAATADLEIDAQLDWIHGLGLNSVRIWLSFPLWYADRNAPTNRMVESFRTFLGKCEQRNLYVMPVFWDAHCYGATPCTEPDYADPAGESAPHANIGHWMPTPGSQKLAEFAATDFATVGFEDYVTEIVNVGRTSPALLMWDAMNEPKMGPGDPNHHGALIRDTLARVHALDPAHPTTIGFTGVVEGSPSEELCRDPNLDVISVHTYGTFRENVETYVQYAATLRDAAGNELAKPVIITEIGQPGWGQSYAATLDYVTETVWGPPSDPTRTTGVGFYIFCSMCGWNQGNFPHRFQHGVFFPDGEVRDVAECIALQKVARDQGIPPTTLTPRFVQKQGQAPNYYPQAPLVDGHDYNETLRRLALPSWFYGTLSETEGLTFAQMLRIVGYDLAVIGNGPASPIEVTMLQYQMFLLFSEIYEQNALFGRSLTPFERNTVLDMWRFTMLPFVAQVRGPTLGH